MGLTTLNKNMICLRVTGDGDRVCDTPLAAKPDGYVRVLVAGTACPAAESLPTSAWVYWSSDGGATAIAFSALTGDGTEFVYATSSCPLYSGGDPVEFDYIEAATT